MRVLSTHVLIAGDNPDEATSLRETARGAMVEQNYLRYQGVTMKPGVRVYCTDRDHGNWDCEGTIVTATKAGLHWEFEVQFDKSTFTLSEDQIWPSDTDTPEAREWKAARQLKVFICHGSEDKPAARELYNQLRKADMNPWLDEVDLQPGQEWDAAIRDAVRSCHIILVCLSNKSVNKTGYVQKEIRFALDRADEQPEGSTYLIPVKLDECNVPRSLSKWQWVNLFDAHGNERLLSRLRTLALERFARS
jgi:hypothetical protein